MCFHNGFHVTHTMFSQGFALHRRIFLVAATLMDVIHYTTTKHKHCERNIFNDSTFIPFIGWVIENKEKHRLMLLNFPINFQSPFSVSITEKYQIERKITGTSILTAYSIKYQFSHGCMFFSFFCSL